VIADRGISIGAHCLISWGAVITDSLMPDRSDPVRHGSALREMSADPLRRLRPVAGTQPVQVGDNVWIGFDSVVMGGVTIGRGAIIGCRTVITADVPPYAIVVGNPARTVRFLKPDDDDAARAAALRTFGIEFPAEAGAR
jgi:acetyltransferase-like isoleucine patch superfamily enzyme